MTVANSMSFLAQKILIYHQRDDKDRAKDPLHMHDTIELFSEHLEELREVYTQHLRPRSTRARGRIALGRGRTLAK